MKAINLILTLVFSLMLTVISVNKEESIPNETTVSNSEAMSFTLTGTLSGDNPSLSFTSVSGADTYKLERLPTPGLGGASKRLIVSFTSPTTYVDTGVHGAALGNGFDEVRYVVRAYSSGILVNTSNYEYYTATSVD